MRPYIGRGPCKCVRRFARRHQPNSFHLTIVTDLSLENMLSGATDPAAIADLVAGLPNATVRFLPSVHAKVYIADARLAVVTSSNMTDAGLLRQF